jgi:hypothetical protein
MWRLLGCIVTSPQMAQIYPVSSYRPTGYRCNTNLPFFVWSCWVTFNLTQMSPVGFCAPSFRCKWQNDENRMNEAAHKNFDWICLSETRGKCYDALKNCDETPVWWDENLLVHPRFIGFSRIRLNFGLWYRYQKLNNICNK